MKLRFARPSSLKSGQILRLIVPSVVSTASLCATAQPFECGPFEEEGCEVLSWVYPTEPEVWVEVFAFRLRTGSTVIATHCQCARVPADQRLVCSPLKVTQQKDEAVTLTMSRGGEVPAAVGLSLGLFAQLGFTYVWNGEVSQTFLISSGQEFSVDRPQCFTTYARDRWIEAKVRGETYWVGGRGLVWCDNASDPQLRECNVETIANGNLDVVYMWAPQFSEWPRNCGGAISGAWRYSQQCCSPIVGCDGFVEISCGPNACCGTYSPN